MVKYWYHRHFKQFGFNPDWANNKHTIDIGGGFTVELEQITSLSESVWRVLDEYMYSMPKE